MKQGHVTIKNKQLVVDFFTKAFVEKKVEEAFNKYVGDPYIQHDPDFPDKKSTIEFLLQIFSNPKIEVGIKRVIAEDDMVVIHVHSKDSPEDAGLAIVEIFRVNNGKIVEHWSAKQPVPEVSANKNTMF
jgi:predicted SnoaL-like aldol condensation-catalyzing enzyme